MLTTAFSFGEWGLGAMGTTNKCTANSCGDAAVTVFAQRELCVSDHFGTCPRLMPLVSAEPAALRQSRPSPLDAEPSFADDEALLASDYIDYTPPSGIAADRAGYRENLRIFRSFLRNTRRSDPSYR